MPWTEGFKHQPGSLSSRHSRCRCFMQELSVTTASVNRITRYKTLALWNTRRSLCLPHQTITLLQRRIPSGMQGFKKSVEEGGIRNYLAVKGPGVPSGVLDNTLLSITDILPTVADLAGVNSQHLPWDGISFANVLRSGPSTQLSTQQAERVVIEMSPHCWSPDTVPELGADRKVLKSQPLLDFDKGGVDGTGFKRCIGVRYKDYKWLGESNKVYRYAARAVRLLKLLAVCCCLMFA